MTWVLTPTESVNAAALRAGAAEAPGTGAAANASAASAVVSMGRMEGTPEVVGPSRAVLSDQLIASTLRSKGEVCRPDGSRRTARGPRAEPVPAAAPALARDRADGGGRRGGRVPHRVLARADLHGLDGAAGHAVLARGDDPRRG